MSTLQNGNERDTATEQQKSTPDDADAGQAHTPGYQHGNPFGRSLRNGGGKRSLDRVNEARKRASGPHRATWNPREIPDGLYYYRLEAAGAIETRRLVVMKTE